MAIRRCRRGQKGRAGEQHPNARLHRPRDRDDARHARNHGFGYRRLARIFECSRGYVRLVCKFERATVYLIEVCAPTMRACRFTDPEASEQIFVTEYLKDLNMHRRCARANPGYSEAHGIHADAKPEVAGAHRRRLRRAQRAASRWKRRRCCATCSPWRRATPTRSWKCAVAAAATATASSTATSTSISAS
jgi:hypothetical protein